MDPRVHSGADLLETPLEDLRTEINAWLNAFIDRNLANGKLDEINVKWGGSKLPVFPSELAGVPFVAH